MKSNTTVVIVSFNTRELLKSCLLSLNKVSQESETNIIVSDNGSTDGSVEMVKKDFPDVGLIENRHNLGFAAGNNRARSFCKGRYVLFLNSDTIVHSKAIGQTVSYLDRHKDVGAITCKILLPNGELDKDARRSFPTPWVAFTHFSHLDRIFPKSKLFARYWYGYLDENKEHEVDVLQGAFCLVQRNVLEKVDWFDETYFLDGEDIDLCWKIKERGYKIMYYPSVSITHIKGASKGKKQRLLTKEQFLKRKKSVLAGMESMKIFYKKHLWSRYPLLINYIVIIGIESLKFMRSVKLYIQK